MHASRILQSGTTAIQRRNHELAQRSFYDPLTALRTAFLKAMSERSKAELRPTDTFARLGGDESIALLPDVGTQSSALSIAQKLAEAVQASNHVHSLPTRCTASMGIGVYQKDGQSSHELMARVDAAMYGSQSAWPQSNLPR